MERCAPIPYFLELGLPSRFRKRPRTACTTTRPNPRSESGEFAAGMGCGSALVGGAVTCIRARRFGDKLLRLGKPAHCAGLSGGSHGSVCTIVAPRAPLRPIAALRP